MTTVETVRGPVDVSALGPTLMHEHIFVLDPSALQNYAHAWGESYWDEETRVADAIQKLRRLRDGGIHTIVDPSVPGLGRSIPRTQRINAEVELNIVVATGVYQFLELPSFLAIVAAAGIETGAPIMVHTNAVAQTGLLALGALTEAGVDPTRVVIAHAGDSNDLGYLRAIADTGASLGYDRFNIPHFNPDANRIETLVALLGEGYARSVHLGHDGACFYDFMFRNPPFAGERPDYLHISERIIPELLAAGVTQEQVDEMLVGNPRRFLAGQPS